MSETVSRHSLMPRDTDEDTEPDRPAAANLSTSRDHHCTAHTGTEAFVPYNTLKKPKVISLASRQKITPAQLATVTKVIIEEFAEMLTTLQNHMLQLTEPDTLYLTTQLHLAGKIGNHQN